MSIADNKKKTAIMVHNALKQDIIDTEEGILHEPSSTCFYTVTPFSAHTVRKIAFRILVVNERVHFDSLFVLHDLGNKKLDVLKFLAREVDDDTYEYKDIIFFASGYDSITDSGVYVLRSDLYFDDIKDENTITEFYHDYLAKARDIVRSAYRTSCGLRRPVYSSDEKAIDFIEEQLKEWGEIKLDRPKRNLLCLENVDYTLSLLSQDNELLGRIFLNHDWSALPEYLISSYMQKRSDNALTYHYMETFGIVDLEKKYGKTMDILQETDFPKVIKELQSLAEQTFSDLNKLVIVANNFEKEGKRSGFRPGMNKNNVLYGPPEVLEKKMESNKPDNSGE